MQDEHDALRFVNEGREDQETAGVEQRQEDDHRRHRSIEHESVGAGEGGRRDQEHKFVGRGFDRRRRAACDEDPEDRIA
jgi:hypothetical protein